MFWLSRPPYWRWLAAGVIVATALYMDLNGPPTEAYPFTAKAAGPGEPVLIDWRGVPVGLLPAAGTPPATSWTQLAKGIPLVPGVAGTAPLVSDGWWALEVPLPTIADVGAEVLVAVRDPRLTVTGVVVAPSGSAGFGSSVPGLVALPGEHAAAVAAAFAEHRASILIRP